LWVDGESYVTNAIIPMYNDSMVMSDTHEEFWAYLSPTQQDLISEGKYLMNDIIKNHQYKFKDYSFLVFPFAKAYEGYLKQLFLDVHLISHLDYISDHYRLGKFLSPNLIERLGDRSLYTAIEKRSSSDVAESIWQTWKRGRNQIFHYFSHNLKGVTLEEATEISNEIIATMELAYEQLGSKISH